MSTIISDICYRSGIYEEGTEIDKDLMEVGKALERSLIAGYEEEFPERYYVPGEIERDGIFGTPDLYDVIDEAVIEFKFTFRSSRADTVVAVRETAPLDHPIYGDKFWKDWTQAKAYCAVQGWKRARLELCHIRGDYREFKVVHNCWEQILTEEEVESHWSKLRKHGERACKTCFKFNCEVH